MNIFKLTILFLLLTLGSISFAQEDCGTDPNIPDFLQTVPFNQRVPNAPTYVVRVYMHIITQANGTGGITLNNTFSALNRLKNDFEPHNICISLLGVDTIKNDTLFAINSISYWTNVPNNNNDINNDGKFDNFLYNSHNNAIDIYFFPTTSGMAGGVECNLPGKSIVIGGYREGMNMFDSPVLTHEFGHALGLYHTFHGTCEIGNGAISEFPGDPNCANIGDYVCDTPADPIPTRFAIDPITCIWDPTINCTEEASRSQSYIWTPRTDLFMSYAPLTCRNTFTPGQGQRMRDMLSNSPIMQSVIVPDELVFTNFYTTLGQDLLYDVRNSITAENSVFVNPSSKLTYRAGHYILLDPGFEVNNGVFEATINSVCSTIDFNNSARSSDSKKSIELDRIDEMSFEVYPNPNNGIFTIESKELTSSIIDVYDLLGQKVKSIQISSTKTLIDLSNFPKGVYLLIYTDKNKRSNKRIILE